MGRSRYKVIDTRPHFLTCTTVNWLILFSQPELAQILLSSLQHLQTQKRLTLHAYVIMENHLHLIASAENLSREMQAFKSFTAQAIIKHLQQRQMTSWLDQLRLHKQQFKQNSTYQVWQEGYHPQVIQSPEMLQQKISVVIFCKG